MLDILISFILELVAWCFDFILFPIYMILQHSRYKTLYCHERSRITQRDDNSITFSSSISPEELRIKIQAENCDNLDKFLSSCTRKYHGLNCLGTRKLLSIDIEEYESKTFQKCTYGEYEWITYGEMEIMSRNFGKCLREFGIQSHDIVAIFSETRAEWLMATLGCIINNIIVATVYVTLSNDGIIHIFNETNTKIVITSPENLPRLKTLVEHSPNISQIIYFENQLETVDLAGFKDGIKLISFQEVLSCGNKLNSENNSASNEDTAMVLYTSGSTGTPKGVILSHKNIITEIYTAQENVKFVPDDVYLGVLPLAHIFEFGVELLALYCGMKIGYSSPLTFSDFSGKIKSGTKGDISVLKPTILAAVPLLLDRISQGLQKGISEKPIVVQRLIQFCINYKSRWLRRGFDTPLLNRFIFKKSIELVGGRIHFILSGGAPLNPDTQELLRVCLNCNILQGYGLTETTGCILAPSKCDILKGLVGEPMSGCKVKLVNWDEANYFVTDKPWPRGEIVCGGDVIAKGYLKLKNLTDTDFYEEDGLRWFRSGDIGEAFQNRVFRVIDRKKDLIKLPHGEYVPLGNIEGLLKPLQFVDNICIKADPNRSGLVALISVNLTVLQKVAENMGIDSSEPTLLCQHPQLISYAKGQIKEACKKYKLSKFEIPDAIVLIPDQWLPETNLLTAAMKVRRKNVYEKYEKEIEAAYKELEGGE